MDEHDINFTRKSLLKLDELIKVDGNPHLNIFFFQGYAVAGVSSLEYDNYASLNDHFIWKESFFAEKPTQQEDEELDLLDNFYDYYHLKLFAGEFQLLLDLRQKDGTWCDSLTKPKKHNLLYWLYGYYYGVTTLWDMDEIKQQLGNPHSRKSVSLYDNILNIILLFQWFIVLLKLELNFKVPEGLKSLDKIVQNNVRTLVEKKSLDYAKQQMLAIDELVLQVYETITVFAAYANKVETLH